MSYPDSVSYPLRINIERGFVTTNRHSLTMLEHKQVIQACYKYKDYTRGRQEREWLVKIHGNWINKVINSWIQEVQGKPVTEVEGYIKVG